jgi:hypothetical protein
MYKKASKHGDFAKGKHNFSPILRFFKIKIKKTQNTDGFLRKKCVKVFLFKGT